jgi:hypothetical protein
MAGKGRRTASRQAELNRRRKRGAKGPSGIPSAAQGVKELEAPETVAVSAGVADVELNGPESLAATEVPVGRVSPVHRAPRPSPVARTPRGEFAGQGQGRLRGERPAAYLYVGAELRRIIVLTGAILAALIVLGILL